MADRRLWRRFTWTDSSDAVVDIAQRLCIAFDKPFI
jgi:hypothetical protein